MKVFISYRRDDSQVESTSIYRELSREIGEENIFFDVDNIPVGVNFKTYLQNAVTECGLMLVIIGKDWADARDQDGERRLEDPRDFVRIELESALTQGLTIVPVLVRGAKMPKAAALPEPLKDFVFLNAAEIAWGRDFDSHIKRLLRDINSIRTTPPPAAPARAAAPPLVADESQSENTLQTGTFTLRNGDLYEGEFIHGFFGKLANGIGTSYWPNGNVKYKGRWVDGQRNGEGTGYWASGNIHYEGKWVNDKRHGRGVAYLGNGHTRKGRFVQGKFRG